MRTHALEAVATIGLQRPCPRVPLRKRQQWSDTLPLGMGLHPRSALTLRTVWRNAGRRYRHKLSPSAGNWNGTPAAWRFSRVRARPRSTRVRAHTRSTREKIQYRRADRTGPGTAPPCGGRTMGQPERA